MIIAVQPLTDVQIWLRGNALEILLIVSGAILAARAVGWIGEVTTGRIDANAEESDALVRSEAAKHRHALTQVVSWTIVVAIYVVAGILVAQRLGVPMGGLVAPAAVVGVALGFGALNWAVLATLFVPAVVLLVPLYKIIVDPPIGPSLINNYLAVWLPAGATAFNVVLVTRFFDSLPREIFEAAEMDGAGAYRLFWSIVLPMSRPIIGVVSVFAVIASWKDFLWPFLVLKSDSVKPLSVYLQSMANVDKGTLMAALAISTVIPIVMFLVFQRMFLRGAGFGGAVKG